MRRARCFSEASWASEPVSTARAFLARDAPARVPSPPNNLTGDLSVYVEVVGEVAATAMAAPDEPTSFRDTVRRDAAAGCFD